MAEMQQYPLPNPGLPLGQQAVSPVAQTNPLQALTQGGVQGFSLGLAARQQQALEQERQVQLMAAQQQARLAQQQALTNAASITHQNFEDLTKVDPDHAVDYYNQAIAPLHQAILAQYGVHMDVGQMPVSHKNADAIDKINSYVDMLKEPSKAPLALQGLSRISNEMDIAEQTRKKAEEGIKTVGTIQDYSKHQDDLIQQERQRQESLRGDPILQQLETKRLAAGQVYDSLKRNQDEKGNFNMSQSQLVDSYANLYRAQSGVGATGEAMEKLDQPTLQAKYAKLAGMFGLSKNALPTEVGNRLLDMSVQLGNFNENEHQKMMVGRNQRVPGIDSSYAGPEPKSQRGSSFPEMMATSDKASKYQPNQPKIIQRKGKDGQIYTYNLNPKTGKYE